MVAEDAGRQDRPRRRLAVDLGAAVGAAGAAAAIVTLALGSPTSHLIQTLAAVDGSSVATSPSTGNAPVSPVIVSVRSARHQNLALDVTGLPIVDAGSAPAGPSAVHAHGRQKPAPVGPTAAPAPSSAPAAAPAPAPPAAAPTGVTAAAAPSGPGHSSSSPGHDGTNGNGNGSTSSSASSTPTSTTTTTAPPGPGNSSSAPGHSKR